MSDPIKHECGIALVRLKRPLSYYQREYSSSLWGFYQLFLLMEKQHNRGQDGSGVGALKLNVDPGKPYMFRERSIETNSLNLIFGRLLEDFNKKVDGGIIHPSFPQPSKITSISVRKFSWAICVMVPPAAILRRAATPISVATTGPPATSWSPEIST